MTLHRDTVFAGLPAVELSLAGGDRVVVAHQGGQVLSWVAGGRERLYLSPRSACDGHTPIRGGVPVCFPQFNQRGPLVKHGFARRLPWVVSEIDSGPESAVMTWVLRDGPETRSSWPLAFEARLRVLLTPRALRIGLEVHNTDTQPLAFTGALHTYLAVSDVAQARVLGLGGQPEWDSLTDRHATASPELRFVGEFDRVYAASPEPLTLEDGPHTLEIHQDFDWAHTVVWNPGAALCAQLPDMPPEGWQHMLCVEAAQVFEPIELAPGESWEGGQSLRVVSSAPLI